MVPGSYLETSFLSGKKIEEKDKTLRLSKFVCSDTLISDQGVLSETESASLARTGPLVGTHIVCIVGSLLRGRSR